MKRVMRRKEYIKVSFYLKIMMDPLIKKVKIVEALKI